MKNVGDLAAANVAVDHAMFFEIEGMLPSQGEYAQLRAPVPGEQPEVWALIQVSEVDEKHNPPGERWLYVSKLNPNEEASKRTNEFSGPPALRALWFRVRYFRETDGRLYESECTYYRRVSR